jgi:hypothetical protein
VPSFLFLVDTSQIREGREMVGEDQGVLFRRKVEDSALAIGSLLGKHVEDRGPLRILEV